MQWILKVLGLLGLWSIVVGIIVLVDPLLVRDVGIPGLYLPLLVALFFALWYSALLIFHKGSIAILIASLITLSVILSILHLMFWFVGIGIVLLLSVICYIHFSQ